MSIEETVQQSVESFFGRIKDTTLAPNISWYRIAEIKDRNLVKWFGWAVSSGVYAFVRDEEVKYIGRALQSTGLMSRVCQQATSWGDPKWDKVIGDSGTTVGVLPLDGELSIWIPSLEVYLINALHPPINLRR